MKIFSEQNNDTYNIGKEENLESTQSYCASGYVIPWKDLPQSVCQHCKANLLPEGTFFCEKYRFPWLSVFKYE